VSSTAGIAFLPASMTYPDNTSESAEFDILPYPVFERGKKVALQRAGGFCLLKSTQRKEDAAVVFLKWLTEPERNLSFVEGSGYLPVTLSAMEKIETARQSGITPIRQRFLEVVSIMSREYDFFFPGVLEGYEVLERRYGSLLRKSASSSREKFLQLLESMDADKAYAEVSAGTYEKFFEALEE
jgi:multiple sugar transport system substrate-binding protein